MIDLEQPADELALSVELDDALVAIGPAARKTPGEHRGLHAPHRLVD